MNLPLQPLALLWCLALGFALPLASHAAGLNDTGVANCGDASTTSVANCANAGDAGAFPRQDARYGRDALAGAGQLAKIGAGGKGFDFSKVANNGSTVASGAALGASATDWACTRDNVTGLLWEVKASSGLRAQGNTYSWYQGGAGAANSGSCSTPGHCDTEKFVADVNSSGGLCGYTDWRLPTVKELENIVDFSQINPSVDAAYFPNTAASRYWTGSDDAQTPGQYAWLVDFQSGDVGQDFTSAALPVRLVRGIPAPPNQFTLSIGGLTVTDNRTGLMWKHAHEMIDPSQPDDWATQVNKFLTWQGALARAVNDRTGGYADWRLPNVKELRSLVDETRSYSAIDTAFFLKTPLFSTFWTSSPALDVAANTSLSWTVDFDVGTNQAISRANTQYVRLVRGGDYFDSLAATNSSAFTTALLSVSAVGSGTVSTSTGGISCAVNASVLSGTCQAAVTRNTTVTLTASPAGGRVFVGWSGVCSGTASTCILTMSAAQSVVAMFTTLQSQTIGTISFSPTTLAVGGTTTASATGGASGNPVTFSSVTTSVCTVSGSNGSVIRGITGGACTIAANQAGNSSYSAAPQATQNITVDKAGQTIVNFNFSPSSLAIGGTTTASATATSGLAVSFSSTSLASICTVSSGCLVTGIGAGNCAVTASQIGDTNYSAANSVQQGITVKLGQTIGTIAFSPSTLTVGGTTTASVTATSGLTVVFDSASPNICTVKGNVVTGVAVGTCSIAANQDGDALYAAAPPRVTNITVNPSGQTISAFSFSPNSLAVGGTTTVSATASSGLVVTFVSSTPIICIVSGANGSIVTGVSAGTCVVIAIQPGNENYSAAVPVAQSISVLPSYLLSVLKTGNGSGTVISNPAAINCGVACSARFGDGARVTLIAIPGSGSTFAGWGGAGCAGTATICTVSMNPARNLTAAFALNLSVTPGSRTFADQHVGTSSLSQSIVLTNTGATALSITSLVSTASVFALNHNCGTSLTAGGSCSVDVIFTPLAAGNQTGAVTLYSNATLNPIAILSGNGVAANVPICSLSAAPAKVAPGRATTLTPNCSPAATSYLWSGGICAGTTAATCVANPTQTTTYGVIGSIGFLSGSEAFASVKVAVDLTPILMLLLE